MFYKHYTLPDLNHWLSDINITTEDTPERAIKKLFKKRSLMHPENRECLLQYGHGSILEHYHKESGRHYIDIPPEAVPIIKNIKIDKVNPAAVRMPFKVVSWNLPDSVFEGAKKMAFLTSTNNEVIESCVNLYEEAAKGILDSDGLPIDMQDGIPRLMYNSYVMQGKDRLIAHSLSRVDSLHNMFGNKWEEEKQKPTNKVGRSGIECMSFIFRAAIFIQAHPEALVAGSKLANVIRVIKNKRGKKRNVSDIVEGESLSFQIPEIYKRSQTAHYVAPHFRSLEHPRYRREDDEGNLLDVGEEGHVRIVPVKGFFKGGRLDHVDQDKTELEPEITQ